MEYYMQGKAALDAEQYDEAESLFRAGAVQADVRCYYGLLAVSAMQGRDCREEMEQMKRVWDRLVKMAEEKDPDACFILGRCYETGSAVDADIQEAMRYYTRAAGRGNLDAMFNLGCIYIRMGRGGRAIAGDYFREAAERGHSSAREAWMYMQKEDADGRMERSG